MARAPVFVSIEGAAQLKELSARLKKADRNDLQKALRANIKEAGKPIVSELRTAVMGVKVTRGDDPFARRTARTGIAPRRSTTRWGQRSTGLRTRTARSIAISQTRKGIRIRVSATRMGPYGGSLPRYMDAELNRYKNWRHPVFGNPEVWVAQRGSPWFLVTIRNHRTQFRKAVFDAMDETGRRLTG